MTAHFSGFIQPNVAQAVEHWSEKPEVVGANPTVRTYFFPGA